MEVERLVGPGTDADRIGAGLYRRSVAQIHRRPAPVLPAVDEGVGVDGLVRLRARDRGQRKQAKKRHQNREQRYAGRNITKRIILLQYV